MATFRCNNYPSFGFNTPDGVGYYFERGKFCTDDLPDEVAELVETTLRSLLEYGVDIFEDGVDYGSKAVREVEEVEDAETPEEVKGGEYAFLDGETSLGTGPGPAGSGIPEGSELADDS